MKRKNKKIVSLLVFMMVAVMFSSSAATVFTPSKTISSKESSASGLVQSYGHDGINTVEEYIDTDKAVEKIAVNKNDKVSVMIEMDDKTLIDMYLERQDEFASYQEYLSSKSGKIAEQNMKAKQRAIFNKIANKVDCELEYQYVGVMNGFAIGLKYKDCNKVGSLIEGKVHNSFIAEKFEKPQYTIVTNEVNAYETGIFDSSRVGYKGEGMIVAVLDTGLDYDHPAFSTENLPMLEDGVTIDDSQLAFSRDYIKEKLPELSANKTTEGLTVSDLYVNKKVPFAYDYADKDTEVNTHIENMHGTHVAGIIAGKCDTPLDEDGNPRYDKKGDQLTGFVGVAPLAQLAIMKVFSDFEEGGEQQDITAGLEDCATLGVDVINMSLGAGAGFAEEVENEEGTKRVWENLEKLGISCVVAAGNSYSAGFQSHYGLNLASNPDSAVVGSPSTYAAPISVASIEGVRAKYLQAVDASGNELGVAYFNESAHVDGSQYDFTKEMFALADNGTIPEKDITRDKDGNITAVQAEYVLIPGVGDIVNYAGKNVRGKIALVQRGVTPFEDKVKNAEKMGALACVVYNNVAGVISMQIGDEIGIPSCSITMDAAYTFRNKKGSLRLDKNSQAGPFMSEFSSWGPTPSLGIKPEITAHGGQIYSAAPGNNYDRISGTSMACPNMAGAVLLLRQHILTNPVKYDIYRDGSTTEIDLNKLEARVYQLYMSTATIAKNEEGNPYAVRKQGAGLASIDNAIKTNSYIVTETVDEEGNKVEMDKSKLELGDDPDRTGVYTLNFKVKNIGSKDNVYNVGAIVTTERLSTDKKTVAEKSYMLDGAERKVELISTVGSLKGNELTVPANSTVEVRLTITLTEEEKEYLTKTFVNGMYVEGFVTLTAKNRVDLTYDNEDYVVSLNIPYLGFFGDWADAPIYDYDIYTEQEDDADDAIKEDDKRYSNGRAASLYAKLYEGGNEYLFPMGQYLFIENDEYENPIAQEEYNAFSDNNHAFYEIWSVGGNFRNVKTSDIVVTDDTTGEVIFEKRYHNGRKSSMMTGAGGATIEESPSSWGCINGGKYTLTITSYLDWDDGVSAGKSNTMSFTFYMDTQAPMIVDTDLRVEEDVNENKTKYLDFTVYDNHYPQAMDLRIYNKKTGEYESIYEEGLRPITGGMNTNTKVSFDVTNYWDRIRENDYQVKVMIYDYTFNYTWYNMDLSEVYEGADKLAFGDFTVTSRFTNGDQYKDVLTSIKEEVTTDENGQPLTINEITIVPNQLVELEKMLLVEPVDVWEEDLQWSSRNPEIVKIDDETGEILGVTPGTTKVDVKSKENGKIYATLTVNVLDQMTISSFGINISTVNNRLGGITVDEESRLYTRYTKALYAGEEINVTAELMPWYLEEEIGDRYYVAWTSEFPEIASVTYNEEPIEVDGKIIPATAYATITANSSSLDAQGNYVENLSGSVLITGKVMERTAKGDKATPYSVGLNFYVYKEFVIEGGVLKKYYGAGGVVNIPNNKEIVTIGSAFYLNKTVTEVIVPEGVEKIDARAFTYCENLQKVKLPSTIEEIGDWAFAAKVEDGNIITSLIEVDTTAFKQPVRLGRGSFLYQAQLGIDNYNDVIENNADPHPYDCKFDLSQVRTVGEYALAMLGYLTEVDLSNCSVVATEGLFGVGFDFAAASFGDREYTADNMYLNLTLNPNLTMGERAFIRHGARSLTIPMKRVDELAFLGGYYLNDLTFTADELYVDMGAFAISPRLINVTFEGSVEKIGQEAFLQQEAQADDEIQYEILPMAINFEKTCKEIGIYAFAYNVFETFELPAGLEMIGDMAIFMNENLKTVTINPDCKLKELTAAAFVASTNIEEFVGESEYLKTVDGVLLSKLDNSLVMMPTAKVLKTYVVPEEVEIIAPYALSASLNLEKVVIHENVREIGDGAFMYCYGLKEIQFENVANLERIGAYAFAEMSALERLDLSAATKMTEIPKYAFSGSEQLKEILLPNTITTIGEYAFSDSGIMEIDIPKGVTEIAPYTFYNAVNLTKVSFHEDITVIREYAFFGTALVNLAGENVSGITEIEKFAFYGIRTLTNIDIANVTTIGEYAFRAYTSSTQGTSLVPLNLPKVETVGAHAFNGHSKLETMNVPVLKTIGESAFARCGLTNIDLDVVETIEDKAFADNKFSTFEFAPTLVNLGTAVFQNVPVEYYTVAQGNEKFFVEDGVVYKNAVYTDEDDVKTEGYALVVYPIVKNVTEYTLKENTVRIDGYAFYGAKYLERVTFPETLYNIGAKAFFAAEKLNYVKFLSHKAPSLEAEGVVLMETGWVIEDKEYKSIYGYGWQNYANFVGNFTPAQDRSEPFIFNNITAQSDDDKTKEYTMKYNGVSYKWSFLNLSISGKLTNTEIDYGVTIEYPANATGFTNFVYANYFSAHVMGQEFLEEKTQNIINNIAALKDPSQMTLDDQAKVMNIRRSYDSLRQQQKDYITNYDKLTAAEAKIEELLESQTCTSKCPTCGKCDDENCTQCTDKCQGHEQQGGDKENSGKKGCSGTIIGTSVTGAIVFVVAVLLAGFVFARKRREI